MGKVISAVEKVVFFDPPTGTTVQLNLISPDETEITVPPVTNNTSTGTTFGGKDFSASVGFYETDGFSQMESWQDDGSGSFTPLNMVVAGEGEFILMQELESLTVERGVGVDGRNGASVHVAQMSHVGYSANIYQFVNIIEAGADAFEEFNITTNGQYRLTFPVEGVTLTLSADYANHATDSTLVIQSLDFTGSLNLEQTVPVDGNGRFSVSIDLPANTYVVFIRFDGADTFADVDITNRCLRLGQSGVYVAY